MFRFEIVKVFTILLQKRYTQIKSWNPIGYVCIFTFTTTEHVEKCGLQITIRKNFVLLLEDHKNIMALTKVCLLSWIERKFSSIGFSYFALTNHGFEWHSRDRLKVWILWLLIWWIISLGWVYRLFFVGFMDNVFFH